MNQLLELQNALLRSSSGAIPLAALVYSSLNSWHCAVMCGPILAHRNLQQRKDLLALRLISYSGIGAAAGFAGKLLRDSVYFDIYRILGFIFFFAICLFIVLPQLFAVFPRGPRLQIQFFNALRKFPNAALGLLWGATPCHILSFYFSLATLSATPWGGAALLFGHAVVTTPALAFATKWTDRFSKKNGVIYFLVRATLAVLVILNLFYFAGLLIHDSKEIESRILYCW